VNFVDNDVAARRHLHVEVFARSRRRSIDGSSPNPDYAWGASNRFRGVDQKVHHDLLYLPAVGLDEAIFRTNIQFNADAARNGRAQQREVIPDKAGRRKILPHRAL
jgi:hypothetical protein